MGGDRHGARVAGGAGQPRRSLEECLGAGPLSQQLRTVLFEESDHFGRGVWAALVGVGPAAAAAVPGVTAAVNHPGLRDGSSAGVVVDGAAVGPAASLTSCRRPLGLVSDVASSE